MPDDTTALAGVSAGIKMSDATLHDAYTHPLPARLMP